MYAPVFLLSRTPLVALLLMVICSPGIAQSLKVGATGGMIVLVPSQSGEDIMWRDTFTRPVDKMGYGFGPQAPAVGLEVKYAPLNAHITLAAGMSYTLLRGSGVPTWLDENPYTTTLIDTKAQFYTASLGGQWELLHGPLRPYIGARLLFSYMPYVEVKKTITRHGIRADDLGEPSGVFVSHDEGIHRMGFGFLAGGELDVVPHLTVDLSARYHFTNLFPEEGQGYDSYFKSLTVALGVFYEVLP